MVKKAIKKRIKPVLLKPRKIKIKVVGLGGGGTSIVSEMAQNLSGAGFLVADTDRRIFKTVKNKRTVRVFHFGEKIAGGMGTGMNPEIAEKSAEAEKEKIGRIFEAQDLTILVGSLGGGVASGAGPVFAKLANRQNNISLGIFTLPFNFEGDKKMRLAKKSLEKLKENLSAVIVIPNERIFQIIDKKTPLKKSLSCLNQMFAVWLTDLIEVISKPSLINIDFADLRTILKGQGETLFFGEAVSQGPQRGEDVMKRLFQNPLLGGPANVKRILFNISGGKDLGIKEVEAISVKVAELNDKAKIIFGISQNPKYNGRIKVTLIALGDEAKNVSNFSGKKQAETKNSKIVKNGKNNKNGQEKKNKKAKAGGKQEQKNQTGNKNEKIKARRSALEIKKEKEEQEKKEWAGDSEWEIPAFLRSKMK